MSLKATLFEALERVAAGTLEPGPANSMAALARAIVQVSGAGELEQRLAALEERASLRSG